jgi:DNA replication protein DnaC
MEQSGGQAEMKEDFANLEFTDQFCALLPGEIGEGMRAAAERRKKKIAEIGYPAYRAEYDAESNRRMQEANQAANAKHALKLLESSGLGEKFFTRTFMTFRGTPRNEPAMNACLDLAEGKRSKGLIVSGPHGIGKTHLAAAVVFRMAEKGVQVYFSNIVDLVDSVKDNFKTGTEPIINRILDAHIIVIDDLGAEHSAKDSNWIDSLLYKIVNRAYESNRILVITTNLDEFDFMKRYNMRIVSRLREMTDWISYDEDDARLIATDEPTPFDQ